MPTEPMTDAQLDEIEARAEAADAGPWMVKGQNSLDDFYPGWRPVGAEGDDTPFSAIVYTRKGARFIAHARQDVPALVAAVRERDAEIERLRGHMKDALASAENGEDGDAAATLRYVLEATDATR